MHVNLDCMPRHFGRPARTCGCGLKAWDCAKIAPLPRVQLMCAKLAPEGLLRRAACLKQFCANSVIVACAPLAQKWLRVHSVMTIPTEPIGSIPRPQALIDAVAALGGASQDPTLSPLFDAAIRDTIERFEATGSPVVSDGEQRKYHNFWDYCVHGLPNMASDGFAIPFAAGHLRRMPRLTSAPFKYKVFADQYLEVAQRYAKLPVKQAVISPSALSLLYPSEPIAGYSREAFIDDLLEQHVAEVRRCLVKGAHAVQIDFTEGRLAVKLDPTGALLSSFIDLNNLALSRFSAEERARIGVHTCPGGDLDSTHSADVDYAELLPSLLQLNLTNYYVALAGEQNRRRVLGVIRDHLRPGQRIFVGVISPIDPRVESAEEVRDRVLEAAEYIPLDQLGTTDDCGFSPFSDDTSTTRDTAFAKITARVRGTSLAAERLGVA
jgi:5-methyltetrahydropteroyltriglutamate--homocysteine methyltransferase